MQQMSFQILWLKNKSACQHTLLNSLQKFKFYMKIPQPSNLWLPSPHPVRCSRVLDGGGASRPWDPEFPAVPSASEVSNLPPPLAPLPAHLQLRLRCLLYFLVPGMLSCW